MIKLIAQASAPAAAASPAPGAPGMSFSPVVVVGYLLLLGAFYFLMIAPQRKKQREHAKLLSSLQSGDEVVTSGGIFGTITNVKEDRFVLRISDNTKIEIGKSFVNSVIKKQGGEEKKS